MHITQEEYEMLCRRMKMTPITQQAYPEQPLHRLPEPKDKMSKTEREYERTYLRDVPHKFEGITLKMSNGHRYTPDFYVVLNGRLELHEVKGSYKLGSYGRAKLAFDQARIEYPEFTFKWCVKTKDGWIIQ